MARPSTSPQALGIVERTPKVDHFTPCQSPVSHGVWFRVCVFPAKAPEIGRNSALSARNDRVLSFSSSFSLSLSLSLSLERERECDRLLREEETQYLSLTRSEERKRQSFREIWSRFLSLSRERQSMQRRSSERLSSEKTLAQEYAARARLSSAGTVADRRDTRRRVSSRLSSVFFFIAGVTRHS